MRTNTRGIVIIAALIASLGVSAQAGYTSLTLPDLNTDIRTWTDGSTYNPLFPGDHTWNGVPFTLAVDAQGHTAWWRSGNAPESLTIPVNVFGVTEAYTIINSAYGSLGTTDGLVEFFGSGGSHYSVPLVQGDNLRDHFDGGFNNTIDGIHALPAFNIGPGRARLDMQLYTLPDSFASETLTSIRFTSGAASASGTPFLAAATVETPSGPTVPVPGALLLGTIGAMAVDLLRRHRLI
jgi:hypothetical protein